MNSISYFRLGRIAAAVVVAKTELIDWKKHETNKVKIKQFSRAVLCCGEVV